jgi:Protein of unknown function (DUF1822)
MINLIDRPKTSIFITAEMHDRAAYLARLQTSPAKARQVYANALAVCAIDWYCHLLDIPSSGAASEGLNPAVVSFQDVSDLDLAEFGKLECRWAGATDTEIVLPAPAQIDRLGCVVVRFDADLLEIDRARELEVLGFTANLTQPIQLDRLKSLSELWEYLERLETIPEPIALKLAEICAVLPQISVREIWQKYNTFWEIDRDRSVRRLNRWLDELGAGMAPQELAMAPQELAMAREIDRSAVNPELQTLSRLSYDIDELMTDWIDGNLDDG